MNFDLPEEVAQTTLNAHVDAVRRAERAGFGLVEVHIAHGYLLHSFLSPLSNLRADAYGGSRAARMSYPLETFEAMRGAWPSHKPMGVRVTTRDWVEGGWDEEDAVVFASALKSRACDYIAASGGTSPAQCIPLSEGYQVPFARRLRQATGTPTMAMGMIFDPRSAEALLQQGDADLSHLPVPCCTIPVGHGLPLRPSARRQPTRRSTSADTCRLFCGSAVACLNRKLLWRTKINILQWQESAHESSRPREAGCRLQR